MRDGTGRQAAAAEPVRRTREIEDWTNLLVVHALSNRLTPLLARLGVRPNAVSLTGMAFGIGAGFSYGASADARFALLGLALMVGWHVLDGCDGQLARLTNTQSETGKILDGICDYVTFIAVYLALAWRLWPQDGVVGLAVIASAGLCHALQSATYERQRQDYEAWGLGRDRDAGVRSQPESDGRGRTALPLRIVHLVYRRIQAIAVVPRGDRKRLDALMRSEPSGLQAFRRRYRACFAGAVRRWSVLSANYRTIAIFLFTALGVPLFYFLYEIVVLDLVLLGLAVSQRRRVRHFLAAVEAAVPAPA